VREMEPLMLLFDLSLKLIFFSLPMLDVTSTGE
jgi:hypothetical protein